MPLIILLATFLYIAICCVVEAISDGGRRHKPFTHAELDELSRQMIGKSQAECRRLLQSYNQK